jgi:hypothetical protein
MSINNNKVEVILNKNVDVIANALPYPERNREDKVYTNYAAMAVLYATHMMGWSSNLYLSGARSMCGLMPAQWFVMMNR